MERTKFWTINGENKMVKILSKKEAHKKMKELKDRQKTINNVLSFAEKC